MQLHQRQVVVLRRAGAKPDLAQPRARAHHDGERLRADFRVERTMIPGRHLIEGRNAVGDHAREDIQTPGRAFGVGGGRQLRRQRHALQQRHDIDAARLQHRALGEVDGVQVQILQLGGQPYRPPAGSSRAPGRPGRRAAGRGSRAAAGWPAGGWASFTWPASISPRMACTGRMPALRRGAVFICGFACAFAIANPSFMARLDDRAIDAKRPNGVIPVLGYVVIWPAGLQPRKTTR